MAVKIRLQRHGGKHTPFYRLVAADARSPRDGRFVEILGTYDPKAKRPEDELKLKANRVDYWLGVGAQPSDTARSLIRKAKRIVSPKTPSTDDPAPEPVKTLESTPELLPIQDTPETGIAPVPSAEATETEIVKTEAIASSQDQSAAATPEAETAEPNKVGESESAKSGS